MNVQQERHSLRSTQEFARMLPKATFFNDVINQERTMWDWSVSMLLKNIIDDPANNLEKEKFSYIIIDCPPSLSLLTIMSLVISHSLVVPLQTEFFALEGLSQLVKTIERIKINLNPNLDIQGIVLTMYDKRNKLCADVEKEGRNFFGNKIGRAHV